MLENKYLSNYQSKEHSKIKNIDILNIGINYAHSYERSFMDDRHFETITDIFIG